MAMPTIWERAGMTKEEYRNSPTRSQKNIRTVGSKTGGATVWERAGMTYDEYVNSPTRSQKYNNRTTNSSSSNMGKNAVTDIMGRPQAKDINAFEDITPYQNYLAQFDGVAESQINPEVDRERHRTLNEFDLSRSANQGWRSSRFYNDRGQTVENIERSRNERIANMRDSLRNIADQQFTLLVNKYYRDPNIDTMGRVGTAIPGIPQAPVTNTFNPYYL